MTDALTRLHTDWDALAGLPLPACTDTEVRDASTALERQQAQVDPIEYVILMAP